jgi:hypothetical protein
LFWEDFLMLETLEENMKKKKDKDRERVKEK